MRKYETIVIMKSTLGDAEVKEEITKVSTFLQGNNGVEVTVENWGKREIAYKLHRSKFGNYISFAYSSEDSQIVTNIANNLRIADSVLKFQTHRTDHRARKFQGSTRKKSSGDDSSYSDF